MSWITLSEVHKAAMSRKRAESAKARGESAVLSPIGCAVDSRSYHASKNGADIRCVLHDGKGEHSIC